uniref:N-acetyltransferase domain-containing protein n=1 Tax=Polysiphonia infestans TaxID=2006978 RepID=A0A1Z1MDX6_9FLOR|nr:hypothetical protein [Polysiphonia infestans]ARW64268.1 hypothetical protein [Polysiphonia infestans]
MTFWKFFFNYKQTTKLKKQTKDGTTNVFVKKVEKSNIYMSTCKKINLEELEKLCDSVGWVRRPLKKVKFALENSFLTISVFQIENKYKRLIGFARVTSDGSFNATIWDVVIHPDFQGNGLGTILMNQVIKKLREYDISTITLFADPQVVKFYQHIGFIVDPDSVKGMFWYPT